MNIHKMKNFKKNISQEYWLLLKNIEGKREEDKKGKYKRLK